MANPKKDRKFLYLAVCIGNLAAFSSGILVGWSSPVNAKLSNETRIDENPLGEVLTSDQDSWISSLLSLGAVFGPIMSGILTTKLGRKKTLLFCSGAPLLATYLIFAFSRHIFLYYIARFVGGCATGTMLTVLPHFLSEISEDSIRGTVSSSLTVFLMSGTLYAYIVGPYLSIMWFNLSCAVWPALFLILFFPLVPESPYYLIASNKPSNAVKSLKKFRSASESHITKEMETMTYSLEQNNENIGSFGDVFMSKASVRAFIITISLLLFQQFSGIMVVLFNAQGIFSATGSNVPAEIASIIIGAVQFAASFITPLAVDRLGRKVLLLISAIGMFFAEVPLGFYFYLKDNGKDVSNISWLPMVCLILYIIFYNVGFGIVPWTVMAEVFPTNIKAYASTIIACFNALLSFGLSKSFTSLNVAIGMGGIFWLFSAFCAMAVPFLIFYMIETKVYEMASYPKRSRKFLYVSVCIADLLAFAAGILSGWCSPVIANLTNENKITENPLGVLITNDEASWIISFTMLGGFSGPIFASFLITKLGPKKTLLFFSGAALLISDLMTAFSKTLTLYYIARYIGGLGYGTLFSVLPQFLSEISEDSIRGKVSSSMYVFLMSGTLYSFIIGPYLSIMWFNISCAIWPALFFVLFLIFVPESPYYLIAANDLSGAIESLKKFRSTSEDNVMDEIQTIKNAVEQDKKNIGSFSDVFKSKASIKALVITASLLLFQQFSGINAVLMNAETIFRATGSDISPEISTIIIGVIQLAASFVIPLVVDKGGRKLLLLISATGMLIAEIPLGLYFYLKDSGKDVSSISWLPMICLIIYITSYNFGFGIVPWTVMAEVFPTNIKATAATFSVCFCGLLAFIITKSFPHLNTVMGMGGMFWLFSVFCAIAIPFVIFYMFETKGKSFQEIQNLLAAKHK